MATTTREQLIDEIGADLLNYLKDGKLEISSFIKEINPNIKDLRALMNIHFILTDRVKYFIYKLPNAMRCLKISTLENFLICENEIRGEINWEQTIKYRLNTNISNETIFICKEEKRTYNSKENLVLAEFLSILYDVFDDVEFQSLNSYEWFKECKVTYNIIKNIYTKNIYISKIEHKKNKITDRMIQDVIKSRSFIYSESAKLLDIFRKISRLDLDKDEFIDILNETLIYSKNTSTIFELYWIVRIIKLNANNEILYTINKGNNLICRWNDDKYIYEIYHNIKGAHNIRFDIPNKSIYKTDYNKSDLVKRLVDIKKKSKLIIESVTNSSRDDNLFSGRPDILIYFINKDTKKIEKLIIGEVKYTDKIETFKEGVEEIQRYMKLGRIENYSNNIEYLDTTDIQVEGLVLVDKLDLNNNKFENIKFISKNQCEDSELDFNKIYSNKAKLEEYNVFKKSKVDYKENLKYLDQNLFLNITMKKYY